MYNNLIVGAVIVAAGKSRRMGCNKLFARIGDMPVLVHTLKVFDRINTVDSIVLVTGSEDLDYCSKDIIEKYGIRKVIEITEGGSERQYSVCNGVKTLKGRCDIIITHDGARPFVTQKIIDTSIEQAYIFDAAACAVPLKDTIKKVDKSNFTVDTPERDSLMAVQTPQTFKYDILYSAHMQALEESFTGTDDTMLVERLGVKVKLFEGSYENIKITTPEDMFIAEAILRYRKSGKMQYKP